MRFRRASCRTKLRFRQIATAHLLWLTILWNQCSKKLPGDVTSDQRQRVADHLSEYDDRFSRGTFDIGRTNLVKHTNDTGSNRPIRESLRRHPRAHLDEIDRQVDELLQKSEFRLCVDYRRLNSVT